MTESGVRKVRITSKDGRGFMARVDDAETGKPIPMAYAFEVRGDVESLVDATVWCHMAEVDFEGEARVIATCPNCQAEQPAPKRGILSKIKSFFRRK